MFTVSTEFKCHIHKTGKIPFHKHELKGRLNACAQQDRRTATGNAPRRSGSWPQTRYKLWSVATKHLVPYSHDLKYSNYSHERCPRLLSILYFNLPSCHVQSPTVSCWSLYGRDCRDTCLANYSFSGSFISILCLC